MRIRALACLSAFLLAAPLVAAADPPVHAPAHGYRSKHKGTVDHRPQAPRGGVEIVYDSGRGVYIGVGLPDIFFQGGHYYRKREGHWEVSTTGRGDWRPPSFGVPTSIVKARAQAPGPAKPRGD